MSEIAICQVSHRFSSLLDNWTLRPISYFSTTASTAAAWTADSSDATKSCGHCDNCTRPPEEVETRNRTLEAWQILQVARAIHSEGGHVTVGMLADLVRGAGGGSFSVSSGSGGKKRKSLSKEKVGLDLDAIAGGKISLGKEVCHLFLCEKAQLTSPIAGNRIFDNRPTS
jgi:ATP-dependent DNA helicase Q1